MVSKGKKVLSRSKIGIVGAGNSAHALACHLSTLGHDPLLLLRCATRAAQFRRFGKIVASGKIEGEFPIDATACPQKLCRECETIFLATTANDYLEVADRLSAGLTRSHKIILFSSKFAGSLEVSHFLKGRGVQGVTVLETDAVFACRSQLPGTVSIRGIKGWTLYSAPNRSLTEQSRGVLEAYFPSLEPAQNIVQRGLTDFGALAHPLTVLVNMNDIDRQRSFLFYYEGYTEKTITLLEQVESEFREVAEAYQTSLLSGQELLHRYYGCDTGSLLEAMKTVPNYRFSQAPDSVDSRYLLEDVPCTLIPVQQLARLAEVQTPMLDAVITMASTLTGLDFAESGRTLARLGWEDLSRAQILESLAL